MLCVPEFIQKHKYQRPSCNRVHCIFFRGDATIYLSDYLLRFEAAETKEEI